VVWLIPILLTVHNAEEAMMFPRFLSKVQVFSPEPLARFEGRLSYTAVLSALLVVSLLGFVAAAFAARRPASAGALWPLFVLEAAVAINVIAHLLSAAIIFRGYGPGLVTALCLNAPFAVYAFRRAERERWLARGALWSTLPAGLFLHGPVLAGVFWLATRSLPG
jgi:hypothetical protein